MPEIRNQSGLDWINGTKIYYETAGEGQPFVMIHAGIADSRQWNNEFACFSQRFQVIRYDMVDHGKSDPFDGVSRFEELPALLEYLHVDQPIILMGCSMGGELAMDFAVAQPSQVKALIMVDATPSGLELDVPSPTKSAELDKAFHQGNNVDLITELLTQIKFDGEGRTPGQVNQAMRQLVLEMCRIFLTKVPLQSVFRLLPKDPAPAAGRLNELNLPVLVIVGNYDTPYRRAAADYMVENLPMVRKVVIEDAAGLPNMDQPDEFQHLVTTFLDEVLH